MVSDRELIKLQVEVLFTLDENERMLGINQPGGDVEPAPRFFFGHTNAGLACRSVRSSSRAYEAGFDTLDAYRQRGHATSVVAAWAHAIRS